MWREADGDPWGDGERDTGCPDPRKERLEIFVTRDAGATWKRREVLPYVVFTGAADFADHRHGAISVSERVTYESTGSECGYTADVQTGVRVLTTDDAGRTFENAYRCPRDDSCLAVDRSSSDHVVVGSTSGAIATSFDGGETFAEGRLEGVAEIPDTYDDYRWIYDIDFATDRVGYAMTNGRGLWRTKDGGRSWTREPSPLDAPGDQGPQFGRIAAADRVHAIAVGPTFVLTRLP